MKQFVVLGLIAHLLLVSANPQNCGARLDEDRGKLIIDMQNDNDKQAECLRDLTQNQDKTRECELNLGNGDGETQTETTEKRVQDLLRALNKMDQITINIKNCKMTDDGDDNLKMDNLKVLKINQLKEDDCDLTQKLLKKLDTQNLLKLDIWTNTNREPDGTLDFVAKNANTLKDLRLNSDNSDIHCNEDELIIKMRNRNDKLRDEDIEKLRKLVDRHNGQIKELVLRCGNDANKFDFIKKNKDHLRMVDTNLDLTKLGDDMNCKNVKRLNLVDMDGNDDNLDKLSKMFPNTERLCMLKKDGLTDDEKNKTKQLFKNLKTTLECKNY